MENQGRWCRPPQVGVPGYDRDPMGAMFYCDDGKIQSVRILLHKAGSGHDAGHFQMTGQTEAKEIRHVVF